jgi:uncharacterized damage-inducible protein DinB
MSQADAEKNRKQFDQAMALMDEMRGKVLAQIQSISQAQADRRPAESEWSVGEIADHLAITERQIMAKLAEAAANAKPHEYDYAEVLKTRPIRLEDSWDITKSGKGTHPPELTPTPGKPLPELLEGLRAARAHTKELLAPLRDQDLSVKFFVHRRMGPMTLYERMAFTAYHDLKHVKQVERALAAARTKD